MAQQLSDGQLAQIEAVLRSAADSGVDGGQPVEYSDHDLLDIRRHVEGYGESIEYALQLVFATYALRGGATASNGGRGGSSDLNYDGTPDAGYAGGNTSVAFVVPSAAQVEAQYVAQVPAAALLATPALQSVLTALHLVDAPVAPPPPTLGAGQAVVTAADLTTVRTSGGGATVATATSGATMQTPGGGATVTPSPATPAPASPAGAAATTGDVVTLLIWAGVAWLAWKALS